MSGVMPLAAALTIGSVLWVVLVIAAPIGPVAVAGPLYLFGSTICHQIAERSFHIAGAQFPVCARCLGIYAGAAGALVALTARARSRSLDASLGVRPPPLLLFVIAAMPTVVTVVLESIGWWETSNWSRAFAGAPLGAGVAYVVMAAIHYQHQCLRRRSDVPNQPPTHI